MVKRLISSLFYCTTMHVQQHILNEYFLDLVI